MNVRLYISTITMMHLATTLLTAMPNAIPNAMPIQAAPVQQQQVAPQPFPAPVTYPQQVAQQQPFAQPVQQHVPQPVVIPTPSINPELLKELDKALQGIEKSKQGIALLLKELDDKLLDARKQAAEAKTLSYNLLAKETEQEAKTDFEKIRTTNKSIQTTQQFLQNEFSKNFNDKISELRVQATQAEAALKAIKAAKTPAALAPNIPVAIPPALPVQNVQPAPIPAPNAPSAGALDSVTSGIASIINSVKNFFSSEDATKKKTITIPQTSEPIPTDAAQRSRETTAMTQQIDQGLQAIDTTRDSIKQSMQIISQSTEYIESLAKETPEATTMLANSKKSVAKPLEEPKWKQMSLLIVSKTLDGISRIVSNIYMFFDATIGGFTRKLIKDVNAKIAKQDAPKSTSGAT